MASKLDHDRIQKRKVAQAKASGEKNKDSVGAKLGKKLFAAAYGSGTTSAKRKK